MARDLKTDLPIEPLIPEIAAAMDTAPNLVLEAPPGAGKTTRVPLALLDASWAKGAKIVMLEPRRLAARAAASRMAAMLGEDVGETIGYRVRMERKIGPKTRIEVMTTGLFLRQLQGDPELSGVAAILFDEFHERTIDGDLALAFAIEAQGSLRPDLRLIVMSATLDGAALATILPKARIIRAQGKSFPVENIHLGDDPNARIEERVSMAIGRALADCVGDVLVFLPGQREIARQRTRIAESQIASGALILPLHGELPLAEQDRAILKGAGGRRKIILATSIAETSLTIDGVEAVVDSGLKRRPRFEPIAGMSRLVTIKASLAAARQRSGRAGRTGPGRCYRLWSPQTERGMVPFDPPEIEDSDLAPLALELSLWGVADPGRLALLTPPPEAALGQARDLLGRLRAINADYLVTPHGSEMATLGAHPRLAHMMLSARRRGLGGLACDIAALLTERDMIRERAGDCDLRHRLAALNVPEGAREIGIDRDQRSRILRASKDWRRQLGVRGARDTSLESAGAVLALAYPDRLAQKRGVAGQYRLANGRGAVLDAIDPLSNEEFLSIGSLDGDKRAARVFLAAPISLVEIEEDFADDIASTDSVAWNPRLEAVEAKRERHLWALVLKARPLEDPAPDAMRRAMIEGIRALGPDCLPWNDSSRALQARVTFLRGLEGDAANWPDCSDHALMEGLEDWLSPYLLGVTRRQHLAEIDLMAAIESLLDWRQRKKLDDWAPTHLVVPSGSRVALDYAAGSPPILKVRLQEMFGATQTPRVAGGRVEVLLHLLSPARRPVQVTRDLASFWANGYRAIRADLRGRYPRHSWPDDPLLAQPTARARPRSR